MNCQQARERLPALIDGELPVGEAAEVEKHLEGCPDCRDEKRRQEQFTTSVKTSLEGLRPSEFFVKGVIDKLGDKTKQKRDEEAAARRTRVSLTVAGSIIVLAAIIAFVHAALTRDKGKVAATVTGYSGEAWLMVREKPGGGWKKMELPREVPLGARVVTGPGGRVEMELTFGPDKGSKLSLHEKSELRTQTRVIKNINWDINPRLLQGAVTFVAPKGGPSRLKVFLVTVKAKPLTKVQVSLQYGDTVVVKVEEGSARILADKDHKGWTGAVNCAAGETWRLPADKSKPPEKVE